MLRFSQRTWNNIIIFTMLLMILLFSTTTKILNDPVQDPTTQVSLLPGDAVILTLDYGQQKIERIGQGWRHLPPAQMTELTLRRIVENWQTTELAAIDTPQLNDNQLVAVVWLAGEEQGRVFQFAADNNRLQVLIDEHWYRVKNHSLPDLFPPGAF